MENNNIIAALARTNSREYNYLKAAEELNELAEVLLKKVTKKGGVKEPSDKSVIEEIGDVEIRVAILKELFDPTGELVEKRIVDKVIKYEEYLEQGKYIGKI
jgi:NTP pyrophosphatase (non-canonical NTP hydrolase)